MNDLTDEEMNTKTDVKDRKPVLAQALETTDGALFAVQEQADAHQRKLNQHDALQQLMDTPDGLPSYGNNHRMVLKFIMENQERIRDILA